MHTIRIGLLGFGTVGSGVVKGLQDNGEFLAARLGARFVLGRVADVDLDSDRGVRLDPGVLTRDAMAVVTDPAIDVIVELIGGTTVARELVLKALSLGKPVVTANKHLLAKYGAEIFGLAAEKRADIGFGASVGGGIPVVRALREGLIANRIQRICGIVNGTCNYILTRMEQEGLPFDDALAAAQAEGYAEANPALDIDGFDTAHKATILASLALGFPVPFEAVSVAGIRGLPREDLAVAAELGFRLKLLAVIEREGATAEVRVHPALLPVDHQLAQVSGVFNGIVIDGDLTGRTMYYGRGAGRIPTAGTVLADLADIARNLAAGCPCRVPALLPAGETVALAAPGDSRGRCYLRFGLADRSEALAEGLAVLERHGIGVERALERAMGPAGRRHAVVLTRAAPMGAVDAAARELAALSPAGDAAVRIRIEC